jgi:hypothetical protein
MLPRFSLLALVVLLAACVDNPHESTTSDPQIISNKIISNKIISNKVVANKIIANKIAGNQLSSGAFTVNLATATELLSTADGREVFSVIVACALPDSVTLETTLGADTFDFPGDVGLVPDWLVRPLSVDGQHWVSACIFSRVNVDDVAIPISLRGPNPALATDSDERGAFTLQEGGFFGNYFTPKDDPIAWFACRGAAQAQGETGGLVNRDCAEPDPKNPSLTQCGFNYAGDCGSFDASHSCEQFADGGTFYKRCHTAPISKTPPPGEAVFLQVITTYVMP